MAKLYSHHSEKFSADQIRQFAQAAQQDQGVKAYRSFVSLGEGKAVCVDGSRQQGYGGRVVHENGPYDSITKVELEGERGNIQAA